MAALYNGCFDKYCISRKKKINVQIKTSYLKDVNVYWKSITWPSESSNWQQLTSRGGSLAVTFTINWSWSQVSTSNGVDMQLVQLKPHAFETFKWRERNQKRKLKNSRCLKMLCFISFFKPTCFQVNASIIDFIPWPFCKCILFP